MLGGKRLFLLDMDGTLYLGDRLFPETPDFLDRIRACGGQYLFLTNNSSKSVAAYVEKLARLGIAAVPEDFFTSTDALILRLEADGWKDRPIYAMGTAAFRQQLEQAGFCPVDRLTEKVACLVAAYDTELTYQKLVDACILLGRDAAFYATNPDWVCPTEFGYVPDCGSVCEMLFRATGKRPAVIGKPQPAMALAAMERAGVPPAETLLVGDRLYTDIACGINAGIDTALVLSGETTAGDLAASDIRPTYVFSSVGEIR